MWRNTISCHMDIIPFTSTSCSESLSLFRVGFVMVCLESVLSVDCSESVSETDSEHKSLF